MEIVYSPDSPSEILVVKALFPGLAKEIPDGQSVTLTTIEMALASQRVMLSRAIAENNNTSFEVSGGSGNSQVPRSERVSRNVRHR